MSTLSTSTTTIRSRSLRGWVLAGVVAVLLAGASTAGIIALGSHSTQPKTASEASAVSQLSHFTASYSDRRPPAATFAAKSRP